MCAIGTCLSTQHGNIEYWIYQFSIGILLKTHNRIPNILSVRHFQWFNQSIKIYRIFMFYHLRIRILSLRLAIFHFLFCCWYFVGNFSNWNETVFTLVDTLLCVLFDSLLPVIVCIYNVIQKSDMKPSPSIIFCATHFSKLPSTLCLWMVDLLITSTIKIWIYNDTKHTHIFLHNNSIW